MSREVGRKASDLLPLRRRNRFGGVHGDFQQGALGTQSSRRSNPLDQLAHLPPYSIMAHLPSNPKQIAAALSSIGGTVPIIGGSESNIGGSRTTTKR